MSLKSKMKHYEHRKKNYDAISLLRDLSTPQNNNPESINAIIELCGYLGNLQNMATSSTSTDVSEIGRTPLVVLLGMLVVMLSYVWLEKLLIRTSLLN